MAADRVIAGMGEEFGFGFGSGLRLKLTLNSYGETGKGGVIDPI